MASVNFRSNELSSLTRLAGAGCGLVIALAFSVVFENGADMLAQFIVLTLCANMIVGSTSFAFVATNSYPRFGASLGQLCLNIAIAAIAADNLGIDLSLLVAVVFFFFAIETFAYTYRLEHRLVTAAFIRDFLWRVVFLLLLVYAWLFGDFDFEHSLVFSLACSVVVAFIVSLFRYCATASSASSASKQDEEVFLIGWLTERNDGVGSAKQLLRVMSLDLLIKVCALSIGLPYVVLLNDVTEHSHELVGLIVVERSMRPLLLIISQSLLDWQSQVGRRSIFYFIKQNRLLLPSSVTSLLALIVMLMAYEAESSIFAIGLFVCYLLVVSLANIMSSKLLKKPLWIYFCWVVLSFFSMIIWILSFDSMIYSLILHLSLILFSYGLIYKLLLWFSD